MNILVNRQPYTLQPQATVADALAAFGAVPPFAAALNTQFVPKQQYAATPLKEGDQLEVIAPITGG